MKHRVHYGKVRRVVKVEGAATVECLLMGEPSQFISSSIPTSLVIYPETGKLTTNATIGCAVIPTI